MIIQTPQKTDDIDLLRDYFKIIFDYFIEEQIYPLVIKEDFFFQFFFNIINFSKKKKISIN